MAAITSQCIVLNEKNKLEYPLPILRQEATTKDTRCVLPTGCPEKRDDLPPSCKMLSATKGDALLLGLLCETQDLCFPDFEVGEDGEEYQRGDPEECTQGCSYMELIHINGKRYCQLVRI
jgi:hypothetical protein